MNVAEKINSRGLKQNWLAKKIGVSPSMLSMYLSGDRRLSEEKEKALLALLS